AQLALGGVGRLLGVVRRLQAGDAIEHLFGIGHAGEAGARRPRCPLLLGLLARRLGGGALGEPRRQRLLAALPAGLESGELGAGGEIALARRILGVEILGGGVAVGQGRRARQAERLAVAGDLLGQLGGGVPGLV